MDYAGTLKYTRSKFVLSMHTNARSSNAYLYSDDIEVTLVCHKRPNFEPKTINQWLESGMVGLISLFFMLDPPVCWNFDLDVRGCWFLRSLT